MEKTYQKGMGVVKLLIGVALIAGIAVYYLEYRTGSQAIDIPINLNPLEVFDEAKAVTGVMDERNAETETLLNE